MLPTSTRRPSTTLRRGENWASEMNRLFDEFLGYTPRLATWSAWTPAADLYETSDDFVLEMELPGFDSENIEVTVERGILTVTGRRTAEAESGDGERMNYHVRERSFDRFSRSFSLPQSVSADNVDAEYRNGILRVNLPKVAEAKPRQVTVKGG